MNFMQQFNTVENAESGATLHFVMPSGGLAYLDFDQDKPKKAVTVTMLGASSSAHKKHAVETIRIMREKAKNNKNKKDDNISDDFFEETAQSQVRRLVSVVTEWANIVDEDGKAIKCTKENVKDVFSKYQELRVQAINFLDSDVNFIKS